MRTGARKSASCSVSSWTPISHTLKENKEAETQSPGRYLNENGTSRDLEREMRKTGKEENKWLLRYLQSFIPYFLFSHLKGEGVVTKEK